MHNCIKALSMFAATCALLALIASCNHRPRVAGGSSWQVEEEKQLRLMRKHLAADTEIHLSVSGVEPANGRTVFLGGSYREPGASYRSVLLVSKDGGSTWHDSGVWLAASEVCHIHCLDGKHAWVLVCWSCEGSQAPFYLLRTTDGGETWQRSASHLAPDIEISLKWPTAFAFTDPLKGTMTFRSTVGDQCKYRTVDGGITWTLVKAETIPLNEDESMSPHGLYSATRREYREDTDWKEGVIYVKALDRTNQKWSVVSRLPYRYSLDGIDVVPKDEKPQQSGGGDAEDRAPHP